MQNFAAIDFETANMYRTSVCSVGLVIVRDGIIADKFYSLIRPTPHFYTSFNTKIHGICKEDTLNAPLFPDVWMQAAPLVEGLTLVAHNSPFDEGCLKAVFAHYEMPYPEYPFLCTCRASRRVIGNRLPNHKLHTVARYCGYNLLNHHHALADAEACAEIALKIL
ncbi:3'-5' exonuclease [Turicimonas muris]|uniref:3'-5' exonuclease n=1 Tax=Turicimonas muris TaxID=1796652 RepID=UPI0023F06BA0|nr:3'-5' exonuclease [Turicimonas muris]